MLGGFTVAWRFGAAAQCVPASQALGQLVGEILQVTFANEDQIIVFILFLHGPCGELAGVFMVCTVSC